MIVKQNNMNLEIIKRKKDQNQKKKEKYVIN